MRTKAMPRKPKSLDLTDYRILESLQKDGRITNVELAEKVHLSPPSCLDRVRRLEREGYIKSYRALLDAHRLGAGLLAFVEIKLDSTSTESLEAFNRAIRRLDRVHECHMVSGGFDYLIKVRAADMQEYRDFLGDELAALPHVRETSTYVVMQEVKSENMLTLRRPK